MLRQGSRSLPPVTPSAVVRLKPAADTIRGKSGFGRVWPLTTYPARFSHESMGVPTATVGRCPLAAVLSMPSLRRSVTALRPNLPLRSAY
jgi:hypothetical protein